MSEVKSKTIIPKRATKTKFASSESILKEGEIALIYPDTGPGTGAAKLVSGDGATVAKNLPIAIDGEAIGELKNSLDIAKKIIPITLTLAGWKSVNGDNSAPYVQTVINEELKSSMNPDLVSMLNESATPEEQEVYNKNLAIISQGVGTVNNGSITYKVYKLPSADITIGLTRLGGVKEVETASGVDDVTVGGVSVVENKVAKIPKIPSANDFVPYEGATKNVNLGNYGLVSGKTESGKEYSAGVTPTVISAMSKSGDTISSSSMTGEGISFGEIGGSGSFFISMENNTETGQVAAKLSRVGGTTAELGALEVASPSFDNEAATKKYVDDNIQRTYGYRKQLGLSDEIGSGKALTIAVELSRSSSKTGIAPDEILSFDVYANASATGIVSAIPTLNIKATTQFFTVNSKGRYTTTKWFVLTNNDPDEFPYSANNAYVAIRTLYPDVTITIKKKALSS